MVIGRDHSMPSEPDGFWPRTVSPLGEQLTEGSEGKVVSEVAIVGIVALGALGIVSIVNVFVLFGRPFRARIDRNGLDIESEEHRQDGD
jgi:hypothetical protein